MERLNTYSLKLKLKRHKLTFAFLDEEKVLQLGGSKTGLSQLIALIILPFLAGTIMLIINQIGFLKGFGPLFIGIPYLFGLYGISVIKRKKKRK